MSAKRVDASRVHIEVNGIITVERIIVCKLVRQDDGRAVLQFKDRDNIRSNCRGTCLVEITLEEFVKALSAN